MARGIQGGDGGEIGVLCNQAERASAKDLLARMAVQQIAILFIAPFMALEGIDAIQAF